MAQLLIAGVGSFAGHHLLGAGFMGVSGAQWGWMIGGLIGSQLFGPDDTESHGPRLNDSVYTGQVEGTDIPVMWGGDRLQGKPIVLPPPVEVVTKQESGGKGGPTHTQYNYTYLQDFAIIFNEWLLPGYTCEPPRRIWMNHELVYDASGDNTETNGGLTFSWYDGTTGEIDSILEDYVGVGNCPSYKNRGLMVIDNFNLTARSGNRLPVIEIELQTTGSGSTTLTQYNMGEDPRAANFNDHHIWLQHPSQSKFLAFPQLNLTTGYPSNTFLVDMAAQYIQDLDFYGWNFTTSYIWFSDWGDLNDETPSHYLVSQYDSSSTAVLHKMEWPTGIWKGTTNFVIGGGGVLLTSQVNLWYHVIQRDQGGGWGFLSKLDLTTIKTFSIDTLLSDTGWYADPFENTLAVSWLPDSLGRYYFVCLTKKNGVNTSVNFYKITWDSFLETASITEEETNIFNANNSVFQKASDANSYDYGITGGHGSPPIFDSVNNEVWFAWSCSGSIIHDYGIGCINADTGAWIYFSDFQADGYTTGGSWGIGSGFPHLSWDPQERKIWWAISGIAGIGSIQIDSKTQKWWNTTTGNAIAVPYANRNSVWGATITNNEYIFQERRLNYVSQATVPIKDVVEDILKISNFEASEYDVSTIPGSIGSFVHATRHPGRQDIEALLGIALCDGVQSDYKLKFPVRGGTVAETIPEDDLAAQEVQGDITPKDVMNIMIPDDIDVPNVLEVEYRSSDNLYSHSISQSYSAVTPNVGKRTTQLPMALSDQQAFDIAEQYHQQIYNPRTFEFSLPIKYAYLEPTDVIEVPKGGKNYRIRLTKVVRGQNWLLKCEGIVDRQESYTSTAVAPGVDDWLGSINALLDPNEIILDGPLLRDSDQDHPGPYLTSFVFGSSYSNAVWFYSFDNSNFTQIIGQGVQPLVGKVTYIPSVHIWERWDDIQYINVTLYDKNASLSSETKANIEADPTKNAYAWGREGRWEYINVATWTLIQSTPEKIYTGTNILRGRRGTDNHIDQHQTGDYFIELSNTGAINRHTLQNSQIGNTAYYKAPREDQIISDVNATSISVVGQPIKPYSPIQVAGTVENPADWAASTAYSLNDEVRATDQSIIRRFVCTTAGTSDSTEPTWVETIGNTTSDGGTLVWTAYHLYDADFSWTRRTRRGGSLGGDNTLTDGVGGNIEEDSELYDLEFTNELTGAVIVTKTDLTSPSYSYLGADQETDGLDLYSRFNIDVYQKSAVVGRGFRGRTIYDRGFGSAVAAGISLGAKAIAPLWDADNTNAIEVISMTEAGTYTTAAGAGKSVTADNLDSLDGDGTGYCKFGLTFSNSINGKTQATIVAIGTGNDSSNDNLLTVTSGGSNVMAAMYRSGLTTFTWAWGPKGTNYQTAQTDGDTHGFYNRTWMCATTCNLAVGLTVYAYVNGGTQRDYVQYGTGSSWYASTFLGQTRDTAYNDTCNGSISNPPTGIKGVGSLGPCMIFDRELTTTELDQIYNACFTAYNDLIYGLDSLVNYIKLNDNSTWQFDYGFGMTMVGTSYYQRGITFGSAHSVFFDTTTDCGYCGLRSEWKLSELTIEIWVDITTVPSGTNYILSFEPIDWNGSAKKGVHLIAHNTSGLRVEVGEGNASFVTVDNAANNMTVGVHHCAVSIHPTNGIKLYLDGTEIANNSGGNISIDWTDGTPGFPTEAQAYMSGANDNNSTLSTPNLIGLLGRYNDFAIYNEELAASVILEHYRRGNGVVV